MTDAPKPPSPRAAFERMLAVGKDTALVRFSLGNECLKAGEHDAAAGQFRRALAHDPGYTAAWKLLGRALAAAGRVDEARTAFAQGIDVARRKGDRQAEKEMVVFARRLDRPVGG